MKIVIYLPTTNFRHQKPLILIKSVATYHWNRKQHQNGQKDQYLQWSRMK